MPIDLKFDYLIDRADACQIACWRAAKAFQSVRLTLSGSTIDVYPLEDEEIVLGRLNKQIEVDSVVVPDRNSIGIQGAASVPRLVGELERFMRDEIPLADLPGDLGTSGVALAMFVKKELVGLEKRNVPEESSLVIDEETGDLLVSLSHSPGTFKIRHASGQFWITRELHGVEAPITERFSDHKSALQAGVLAVSGNYELPEKDTQLSEPEWTDALNHNEILASLTSACPSLGLELVNNRDGWIVRSGGGTLLGDGRGGIEPLPTPREAVLRAVKALDFKGPKDVRHTIHKTKKAALDEPAWAAGFTIAGILGPLRHATGCDFTLKDEKPQGWRVWIKRPEINRWLAITNEFWPNHRAAVMRAVDYMEFKGPEAEKPEPAKKPLEDIMAKLDAIPNSSWQLSHLCFPGRRRECSASCSDHSEEGFGVIEGSGKTSEEAIRALADKIASDTPL